MRGIYLLLVAIALITVCRSASFCTNDDKCSQPVSDAARYDYYRMYYVQLDTAKQAEIFQKLEEVRDGCTFYGQAREPGQNLTIMVAAHKVADFVDILKTYDVKHRVLTYNLQENINKSLNEVLPKGVNLNKFDWLHFFHLETIYEWLGKLAQQYEEVTLLDMGTSTQGLPIKGIKLARNASNEAIFIESGVHGREWIGPATATYIINQLLTSRETTIQNLANNFNWIIFPLVNPDGYKYSFEIDRMWRKNRQLFGACRGVDLSQNYPFHWNETGLSPDSCRYDFGGPSGASEVETQRLLKFVQDNTQQEKIKTYIDLHSFSQLIMFPYGFTRKQVSSNTALKAIGEKASDAIKQTHGRVYKSGIRHEALYGSFGGGSRYSTLNIPQIFTFELYGPQDSIDLFIPPAVEILPASEEAFAAIRSIVEEMAARGYYT